MSDDANVDWATGLSQLIQQLASEGASDEMINRYIEARRTGDSGLATRILDEPRSPGSAHAKQEESAVERALKNIRIAALRPEVNQLKGPSLLQYVLFVVELSEQIVKLVPDEALWESTAVTATVAQHVRNAAMEWLQGNADVKSPG